MSAQPASAYLWQFEQALQDIDWLERRLTETGDEYALMLISRLRDNLNTLDAVVFPTAHEFYVAGYDIEEAVDLVDRRRTRIRGTL